MDGCDFSCSLSKYQAVLQEDGCSASASTRSGAAASELPILGGRSGEGGWRLGGVRSLGSLLATLLVTLLVIVGEEFLLIRYLQLSTQLICQATDHSPVQGLCTQNVSKYLFVTPFVHRAEG